MRHSLATWATALQHALPKVAVHGGTEARFTAANALRFPVLVHHEEVVSKVFPNFLPAFLCGGMEAHDQKAGSSACLPCPP